MYDKAMRTVDQMDEVGTPRSVILFNALLLACNQSKLYDIVPVLFYEIPGRYNLSPDKISYGLLVKSYCEAGSAEKALELLNEMENKGVEVNAVAFTTALNSLYKKGSSEEAERLWREMVKKGCELDVAAYNVSITNTLGGDPVRLKDLIDEMVNMPDTITYNFLMTCYCKNGMMDEAKKVYEGLDRNSVIPMLQLLGMYYLCRSGDYDKGYKAFKESARMHKVPDFNTMKILVEGLVKKKKMKEAKGLIRTIKKKFPLNLLKAWKKVVEDLGLVSASAAGPGDVDQEATG